MLTSAQASGHKTRKGRPGKSGPINILISSGTENSTTATRLQRLRALCGVTGRRAELIALLIWGEADHG
jgi:hypothetical protein